MWARLSSISAIISCRTSFTLSIFRKPKILPQKFQDCIKSQVGLTERGKVMIKYETCFPNHNYSQLKCQAKSTALTSYNLQCLQITSYKHTIIIKIFHIQPLSESFPIWIFVTVGKSSNNIDCFWLSRSYLCRSMCRQWHLTFDFCRCSHFPLINT